MFDRSVWADVGANGLSEGEGVHRVDLGRNTRASSRRSSRRSGSGCLLATPEADRERLVHDELERRYGADARDDLGAVHHAALGDRPLHPWLRDPLVAGGRDAVGPLHGTHDPPFYVCGSDQWVAGYMEGPFGAGRGRAAAAALARGG